jgi:NAD(P)-dependent dehydrogenase (short-subunit alcohol dehydrogenase family)
MSNRLEGKVAAITGAASGFGAAAAARFIREGGRVVLGDIQADSGEAMAAQLGDAARFCLCDVTQEDQVANLVDTAVEAFGKIDIMYNNAGIVGAAGPIHTTPAEEWKFTIDILLNGVFYGIKHAARAMIPQKSGSIINMASTAGIMGGLGPHAYAASKHGVIGITKNTAAELAHHGIRVNAIAPSGMATAMVAGLSGDPTDIDGTVARLAAASPLKGRAGVADDVANAALWLASDESGYTTGHTLTTDAGTTIGASTSAPNFEEYTPLIREAGKRGLET